MAKKVDDKTLLAMCLTGQTQTQMAKELGMTKAQICRRINTDDFQTMLSQYRKRVLDGILTDLTANAQKSVKTLVKLLDNRNAFVQFNAASKILSMAQEYGIQKDLMRDIEDLKRLKADEEQI